MNKLVLKGIEKSFRNNNVICGVNLEASSGEIVGLVGENGCGKTVLMKIMIGLMKSTKGQVVYNDKILKEDFEYLPSVGFIVETPGFYDELTAFENLQALASIKNKIGKEEIENWINKVGLKNDNKKVGKYSLGMRQRLAVAQSLMENPDVIILDEVTNSLDDKGVDLVYTLLKQEKEKGKIIIISSHYSKDIQFLCDRVYKISEGCITNEK